MNSDKPYWIAGYAPHHERGDGKHFDSFSQALGYLMEHKAADAWIDRREPNTMSPGGVTVFGWVHRRARTVDGKLYPCHHEYGHVMLEAEPFYVAKPKYGIMAQPEPENSDAFTSRTVTYGNDSWQEEDSLRCQQCGLCHVWRGQRSRPLSCECGLMFPAPLNSRAAIDNNGNFKCWKCGVALHVQSYCAQHGECVCGAPV